MFPPHLTPARCFLNLRAKSAFPCDPLSPPSRPPSFHHPALLLSQHPSRAISPTPTGGPVSAFCTTPVLPPWFLADPSVHTPYYPPQPTACLCFVFTERSLCLGLVPPKMCAPQGQGFIVEALIPSSKYSTHSLLWVCQVCWPDRGFWNSPSWPNQVRGTLPLLPLFHGRIWIEKQIPRRVVSESDLNERSQ